MKFKFLLFIFVFIGIAIFAGHTAYSQSNPFNIDFPIPELGNCGSFAECENYCDDPAHINACIAWAEGHGFDVEGDIEDHEDFVPPEGGPGGCTSESECHAYCEEPTHFEECVNFALEKGHLSPEEAEQILRGGPGGCRTEAECDAFCSNPENETTCIEFAIAEGHLSPEEAENVLRGGPGGCRSHEECQRFCFRPENQQECFEFAIAEGHLSPEEASRIQAFIEGGFPGPGEFGPRGPHIEGPDVGIDVEKAIQVLEELGGGPGGCVDFNECDAFCSRAENDQVCFDFAIEHGLIDTEHAEELRLILENGGPGGCIGRECEEFCNKPGNEEECLAFAEEHGLISPEELAEIKRFMNATADGGPGGCVGRECEEYCNNPNHRDECFEFATSHGLLSSEELKEIEKFRGLEEKIQDGGGPGGCSSENECRAFCSDPAHFDECAAFAVNQGFMSPEEAEHELRRFIEIEQFGHEGFGPGSGEFDSRGFSPSDFENIPPEFRDRFESEFRSRFEQFEQYRGEFEHDGFPTDGFDGPPPEGFDGFDGFRPPEEFIQSGFDGFGGGIESGDSHVMLTRNPSGTFSLQISDPQGIEEFSFAPAEGAPYSGGLGCDKEFKSETAAFGQLRFPLDSFVLDCSGNRFEFIIPSLDNFDSKKSGAQEATFERFDGSIQDGFVPEDFEEFFPEGFEGFLTPETFEGSSFDGIHEESFVPSDIEGFEGQFEIDSQLQFQEEFQRQFEIEFQQQFEQYQDELQLEFTPPDNYSQGGYLETGLPEGTTEEGIRVYLVPKASLLGGIIQILEGFVDN